MSAGITGSKGSSDTKTQQNGVQANTVTPNNLPFLQQGWNFASSLLPAGNNIANGAQATIGPAQSVAGTGNSYGTNFASGMYADNPANAYLTPFARGDYVSSNNPQFQQVIKNISDTLQPQIDGSFAAAGRYGSGANANAFASALTREAANLGYTNYTQQQQNQLQAANSIANNNATGRQQQLAGVGLIPSLTENSFTPETAGAAATYAPLLAYIQAIAASNGGGTTNGNFQTAGTSNTDTSSLDYGVSAGTGGK